MFCLTTLTFYDTPQFKQQKNVISKYYYLIPHWSLQAYCPNMTGRVLQLGCFRSDSPNVQFT